MRVFLNNVGQQRNHTNFKLTTLAGDVEILITQEL
jgi:hypothetical protein